MSLLSVVISKIVSDYEVAAGAERILGIPAAACQNVASISLASDGPEFIESGLTPKVSSAGKLPIGRIEHQQK